jgi:single-stranded-DNA-specific exonuclease
VIQFGGHDFAAGLSIEKSRFEAFRNRFEEEADKVITEDMFLPTIEIDRELKFGDITDKFYKMVDQMAPFGPQNMQPVFATFNLRDAGKTKKVGKTGNHIRFEMEDENGIRYNGIAFGLGDTIENFQDLKQFSFDICYHIQANEFNGKISLDMIIKDVKINKNK